MPLTDLRYALRSLRKARGFAFVTIATLAIGIGATTAIFAAVSAFFLRPLPYPDADRIVRLRESFGQQWQGSVSEEAVFSVRPMSEIVGESVAVRQFQTLLISLFAAVALVLASLGIYGVMAYHVGQRTQEMGIRMALGARAAQLQAMVIREGMVLAVVGLGIGLAGALAVSQLLGSMLFEVGATDAPSYALSALVLGAVALLACWLPARRATRVDPVAALRAS